MKSRRSLLRSLSTSEPPGEPPKWSPPATAPPSNAFTHPPKQYSKHCLLGLSKQHLSSLLRSENGFTLSLPGTVVWFPLTLGVRNSSVRQEGGEKPSWKSQLRSAHHFVIKTKNHGNNLTLTRNSSLLAKRKASIPVLLSLQTPRCSVLWGILHSSRINQGPSLAILLGESHSATDFSFYFVSCANRCNKEN